MQNQKGLTAQTFSLTGLDLFTPDYPSLRAFKRLLLTGQTGLAGGLTITAQINQALADLENGKLAEEGLNPYERLLALVLLRGLKDADRTDGTAPLSLLVHLPGKLLDKQGKAVEVSLAKIADAANLPLNLDHSAIIAESFENVLKYALDLPQKSGIDQLALCGFFNCANTSSPDITDTGLGCLILSKQAETNNAYAQLIWDYSPQDSGSPNGHEFDHIETYDLAAPSANMDSVYSQLQSAPVVKMIQSALSLNNQARFPQPDKAANPNEQPLMRPWFPLPYAHKRECLLSLPAGKSLRMEKEYQAGLHPDQPFANYGLYLLPLAFDEPEQAIPQIQAALDEIKTCQDLEKWIKVKLNTFSENTAARYTISILGASSLELISELERALSGLSASFEKGRDWQTPSGSYFTPNPFGANEKIAFVYPGAFGTYVGMGREIFYLFPQLYEALQVVTEDPGKTINEQVIFPQHLTPELQEELQAELNDNPTEMISSGVCFSHIFTVILQEIFKIQPQSVFGYSLGENSMMFATGLWSQADGMRTSLEASPIFHQRVSGRQNAIREYWDMPPLLEDDPSAPPIWANYVLMAPLEKVREALQEEEHVYLTHINTPRQVVIGGEPQACQRVAQTLNCMHLQAPYHHAIHCAPIASEFEAFARMHDWPVEYEPDIPVYSAADYAPLRYDSASIAQSFAKMLTQPIDFPRLVDLAYQDGARIFIELGAGSNCSKWVQAILKGRPHTSISINQNNVPDHIALLKLLARLVSQRIPLNLTALEGYSND